MGAEMNCLACSGPSRASLNIEGIEYSLCADCLQALTESLLDNANTSTSTSKNVRSRLLEATGSNERVITAALLERSIVLTSGFLAALDEPSGKGLNPEQLAEQRQHYRRFLAYAETQIQRLRAGEELTEYQD